MRTRTLRPRLLSGLVGASLLALAPFAQAQDAAPTEAAAPAPAAPAAEPTPAAPAPAAAAPAAPAAALAAPAPAPDAAATAATDAEAAALAQQITEGSSTGNDDYKLDIYGSADFTYGLAVKKFVFGPPNDSFAVGNFNLYLSSNLGDKWKTLGEVRFTYLPHGSVNTNSMGQTSRADTTSGDYTDLGRPVQPGGIIIERAYLEYSAHPLLNIRGGHFLTPYGIWNVDHGSPVIIGVRRPFIIGEQLLPESQTGLEIYGTHHFDPVLVGYHLTVSNGRGPISTYQDLNRNKALGGRLYAHADTAAGGFTLGTSFYSGRYTDKGQQYAFDADGALTVVHPITSDYKELSLGADLKWEAGGFLLQSEAIMNDVVYQGLRPADPFATSGPPGLVPDYRRVGVYGLTGYRFPLLGIMPFAGGEYYDTGKTGAFSQSAAFWGGINMRPTPRVVLKAQYTYSWFPGDQPGLPKDAHYNSIDMQAAWSF